MSREDLVLAGILQQVGQRPTWPVAGTTVPGARPGIWDRDDVARHVGYEEREKTHVVAEKLIRGAKQQIRLARDNLGVKGHSAEEKAWHQ